jgi:predicted phage terminase large subunit-like protein
MTESNEARAARIVQTVARVRASPYIKGEPSPKQWAFLADKHEEVLFGGAAGGGKSWALLAAALMYVDVPGYSAVLIRRSIPDLSQSGGLIPMSHDWLQGTDAHWGAVAKKWTFPSGATLSFGHLEQEADMYKYQGGEYDFIGVDEVTQLAEVPYLYLLSRLRQSVELAQAGVPLRARCSANPGGKYHEWVKGRFVTSTDPDRYFIPSTFKENPHINQEAYAKTLSKLDPVTRAQLEAGDWDITTTGHMFSPSDIKVREGRLPDSARRCRVWDLATGNEKSDWTVGTLMAIHEGQIRIEHVWREKAEPGRMEKAMAKMAEIDGRHVPILIEQERGSAGTLYLGHIKRDVLKGYTVVAQTPTGHKEDRAMHASALASQGRIEMTEASWNQAALSEMSQFPGGAHDDIVDTISYGTLFLTRRGAGSGRAGRAAGTEEPLQKAIVDATLRRRRPTDTRWGVVSNYSYLRQVDPYK